MSDTIFYLGAQNLITSVASVIGSNERVFFAPSRGLREELIEAASNYANIFIGPESTIKESLYAKKSFEMEIHTWVKKDKDFTAMVRAKELDALIQVAILPINSTARKDYFLAIEMQDSNSSDIVMYDEGLCVAISRYNVTYKHAYGNPFQLNP